MSRPIRKHGETIAHAIKRSDTTIAKKKAEVKTEVKILKKQIKQYETMIAHRKRFPDELTCRECHTTKSNSQFKIFELDTRLGLCNKCDREGRLQTERMKKTGEAADKATNLMAETLRSIDRLFARHKLPLEKNVIGDVLVGTTEIISNLQTAARYAKYDAKAEPLIGINDVLNIKIVWPLVLYAFKITNYNQVKTAKILGISRNTLRERMSDIQEHCPHLINEYRCQEKWPNMRKTKVVGYLEMDPDMEVIHEESSGGIRVIDSSISS